MQLEGGLGVERMCEGAGVSRAGFYRYLQQVSPEEEDMAARDEMQRIALSNRFYGYRRVTAMLRRQGMVVNHKRVLRLMREDNLLSLRRRKFIVTTDSAHRMSIYPNLARYLELTAINQLWVSDITYISLGSEFVYLAVILDGYSRRVLGWALSRTLDRSMALLALERALQGRPAKPGLVHHSDRGSQYCSEDYIAMLEEHGMVASMSRAGNPFDNAMCESFIKTLKSEQIAYVKCSTMEELEAAIEDFIEMVYNKVRLHSALGYQSPEEFESVHPAKPGQWPAPLIFEEQRRIVEGG
jgi:putative transposase